MSRSISFDLYRKADFKLRFSNFSQNEKLSGWETHKRMMAKEQVLAAQVDKKTTELQKAKNEIELYSRTLEQQVAERTAELVKTNNSRMRLK